MGEIRRNYDGSYAQYALLPNEQIYPVETKLSLEKLVALPETYYTAFGAFKNLKLEERDKILVRAATSGVGLAFLRLVKAKFPKAQVTGSTRNLAKSDQVLQAGFDQVIEDKAGQLQTDDAFDKVLELIGPATIKDSFAHTAEAGIVCSLGQLGGRWYLEDYDPIMVQQANTYLTTFYSGNVSGAKLQELLDYIQEFAVDTSPEKVFSLDQIVQAHQYLESQAGFGKVIVLNED